MATIIDPSPFTPKQMEQARVMASEVLDDERCQKLIAERRASLGEPLVLVDIDWD